MVGLWRIAFVDVLYARVKWIAPLEALAGLETNDHSLVRVARWQQRRWESNVVFREVRKI